MRIDRRRVLFGLWLLVLVLSFATGSAAQGRRADASAATAVQDVVAAVDTRVGTIVIGSEKFKVSDQSRLLDAAGRRIRLSELRAGTTGDDADMVEFLATRGRIGERRTIRRLQVIEGDFE